jgi:hypothetical protein
MSRIDKVFSAGLEADDAQADAVNDQLIDEAQRDRAVEAELRAGRERGDAFARAYNLGHAGGRETARKLALILADDPHGNFEIHKGSPREIAAQALRELARRLAPVKADEGAEVAEP